MARIVGLKRSPFCEMELPRMTKLRPTSKSRMITRLSLFPAIGASRLILSPVCPALGHLTAGFVPFFNTTFDLSVSRISRNPLYVPVASADVPRFVVLPPLSVRRSNDALGEAIVVHPDMSLAAAADAESVDAVRASTRTTNTFTEATESNAKGASVSCTVTLPAPDAVESLPQAVANTDTVGTLRTAHRTRKKFDICNSS